MTVNDIFEFLNGIAPVNTACDFDNAGIFSRRPVGRGERRGCGA